MDVELRGFELCERLHGVIGGPAGCQTNEALSSDNSNLHEGNS